MKAFQVLCSTAIIVVVLNARPAFGLSYWDVSDGDRGFSLKFSDQFAFGSVGSDRLYLPSAYWVGSLSFTWEMDGNRILITSDVEGNHTANGTGYGPWLECLRDVFIDPNYPPTNTHLDMGADGWGNSIYGVDFLNAGGTLNYDIQSGMITVDGSLSFTRTGALPPETGVPDSASTAWLAAISLGTLAFFQKLKRGRKLLRRWHCRSATAWPSCRRASGFGAGTGGPGRPCDHGPWCQLPPFPPGQVKPGVI